MNSINTVEPQIVLLPHEQIELFDENSMYSSSVHRAFTHELDDESEHSHSIVSKSINYPVDLVGQIIDNDPNYIGYQPPVRE